MNPSYKEKSPLCFYASCRNGAQFPGKFLNVYENSSIKYAALKLMLYIVDLSCGLLSDLHLISSVWKYACWGITWTNLSAKHWLSPFIIFSSCSKTTSRISWSVHNVFIFWLKRGLMSASLNSRNIKYTDLYKYDWIRLKEFYSDLSMVPKYGYFSLVFNYQLLN